MRGWAVSIVYIIIKYRKCWVVGSWQLEMEEANYWKKDPRFTLDTVHKLYILRKEIQETDTVWGNKDKVQETQSK